MNQATQDFIRQHQDEDVRQLAFLGNRNPEVDLPFALDQIRGRKMARAKLPRWAEIDGIIYPPHISMEQCSSEFTAQYKAELAARLLNLQKSVQPEAKVVPDDDIPEICEFTTKDAVDPKFVKNEAVSFVDLTGGFGVDFSYIAARLGVKAMYVEQQTHLCEAAKENFKRLGLENVEVTNGDGVDVLHSFPTKENSPLTKNGGLTYDEARAQVKTGFGLNLIFIDPARRDDAGNKVVSLQDCTPDVTCLQDEMLAKADFVIIKLSPMLDWHRAVDELRGVKEVHIISTGNECKELLLVLSAKDTAMGDDLPIFCVNDQQRFSFGISALSSSSTAAKIASAEELMAAKESQTAEQTALYLYEPNASLMKAGCFGAISEQYQVKMLASNSHLFVSDEAVEGFPGRSFRVKAISTFNKKELKRNLAGITKASIATRNFPLSVAELRKRLKLKDGGDTYLFATTLADESHVLFICEKRNSRCNP